MAKIIELIQTTHRRGAGTDSDPVRRIDQLFTKDGWCIAEHDPCDKDRCWYDPRIKND